MPQYKAGDLVWVHIGGGYGWWPCQVMEPKHVSKDRRAEVLRLKRAGCVLVHCHGDKTFNWYEPKDVEPISRNFSGREGQRHKSAGVKRFFKLALEEVQELLAVRAGKPPATHHDPVDFTRPETYEIWLNNEPVHSDDWDPAMQYPAEAVQADAEQYSAVQLLQWLAAAAAAPQETCQDLVMGSATAGTAAAMRMLWSYCHHAAVEQHGSGAFSSISPKQHRQKGAKAGKQDASAAHADAGKPSKKQQQQAGSKRKASAAAAVDDGDAAAGKKQRHTSSIKQKITAAAAESDAEAEAAATEQQQAKKKKRKKIQRAPAPAYGADSVPDDNALLTSLPEPFKPDDPQLQDAYLMSYGGAIKNANIRKAVQLQRSAAVAPEKYSRLCTHGVARSHAVFMRWREAVMARSSCHMEGEVGVICRGSLERVGAMPIRPWLPSSDDEAEQQQQQGNGVMPEVPESVVGTSGDITARAAVAGPDGEGWSGSSSSEDLDEVPPGRRRRRSAAAAAAAVKHEHADLATESDVESDYAADGSDSDGTGHKKQQQGRTGSARAAAAAAAKKKRLADFEAVQHAGSREQRQQAKQQHLQHAGVKQEAESSDSDDGAADRAAAAAAASTAVQVEVAFKDYSSRIGSKKEFESSLQRWIGERGNTKWKMPKAYKQELTMDDLYAIFKLVAEQGGFDAADANRAWQNVAKDWSRDYVKTNKNAGASIKSVYLNSLLGYEKHLSHGCPVTLKTVTVTGKGAAARAAAAAAGKPAGLGRRKSLDAAAPGAARKASQQQQHDDEALTQNEAALAAEAAAPPPLNPNMRRVTLKFRQDYKLPPQLTFMRPAKRYEENLPASNIKMAADKAQVHIIFSTAEAAAAATEGFKTPWGRKVLRMPESEPPLVVELGEVRPPVDWRQIAKDKARQQRSEASAERPYSGGGARPNSSDSQQQYARQNKPYRPYQDRGNERDRDRSAGGGYGGYNSRDRRPYDRPVVPAPHTQPQPHPVGPPTVYAAAAPPPGARILTLPPGTQLPGGIVVLPPPGLPGLSGPLSGLSGPGQPGLPGLAGLSGPGQPGQPLQLPTVSLPGIGPLVMAPPPVAAAAVQAHAPIDPRRQKAATGQQQPQSFMQLLMDQPPQPAVQQQQQQPVLPPPPQLQVSQPASAGAAPASEYAAFGGVDMAALAAAMQNIQQQQQQLQPAQQPPPQLMQPAQSQQAQGQQQQPAFSTRLNQLLNALGPALGQQNNQGTFG